MDMNRRIALRSLGLAAATGICATCFGLGVAHAAEGVHWGYEGAVGPGNWGKLSADFKTCEIGLEQTPIDLKGSVKASLSGVELDYRPMQGAKIVHNGHTIQVNAAAGQGAKIDGERYELVQFHWHHPSEHLLSGKSFDLELHFVHRNGAGQLAVVGVFMKPGGANAALDPIWKAMPKAEGPEALLAAKLDLAGLVPKNRAYYRYFGSLTTPPCSEGVKWTVFRDALEISPAQVQQFAQLFPLNARPVQTLNNRYLLERG